MTKHHEHNANSRTALHNYDVVIVVFTPPLPRDGGTARTAIHVHVVNLIELG